MKLSFVTGTPEMTIPLPVALGSGSFTERLEKASRWGYDGVELMTVRPYELDARAIRGQIRAGRLEVSAIASGAVYLMDRLSLLAETADAMNQAAQRLDALIDFASEVGSSLVTVGSFRGRLAWAGEGARGRLAETLRKSAARAAGCGVRLVIEPLNRYESDFLLNARETLDFIKEVGHGSLGLLLDTYHVNIEEPSVTECFRRGMAADRLWHVHLGDSNRLAPGMGHFDFASVVTALQEGGYTGFLSAELWPRPDPDTAAEVTIGHMRRFVPAKR